VRRPLKSRRFVRDESGQTAAEYVALILAVVILLAFGGYILNGALHISMNGISNWTGSIDPPGAPQGPGGASAQGQGGAGPAPGGQGSGGGVSRSQGGGGGQSGSGPGGNPGSECPGQGTPTPGSQIPAQGSPDQSGQAQTPGSPCQNQGQGNPGQAH